MPTTDSALRALAWGLQSARSRPGQSDFWSVAQAAHFYERASDARVPADGALAQLVDDVALINSVVGYRSTTRFRGVSAGYAGLGSTLDRALGARIASPQGIPEMLRELLGYVLYAQLIDLIKARVTASEAALVALFLFNPDLLLLLLGIAGFIAFVYWLISLLSALVAWWKNRPKPLCCPESIAFSVTTILNDPCAPGFAMAVVAKWLGEKPCDCNCCEVRQFVSMGTRPRGKKPLSSFFLLPSPPYREVHGASLEQMIRSDDPWALHLVGDDVYLEDQRFASTEPRAADLTILSAEVLQQMIQPGAKEAMGPRMKRYGVNIPDDTPKAQHSPCKYSYSDYPGLPGCTRDNREQEAWWKFVVVIRPRPGCDGVPKMKQCELSAGCSWVGAGLGQPKDVVETDFSDLEHPERHRKVPGDCKGWAKVGKSCAST